MTVEHRRYEGAMHGFFTMPGVIAKATQANLDGAAALRRTFATASAPV